MLFFLNFIIFLCLVDHMESMLYSPDQCITDFTISCFKNYKWNVLSLLHQFLLESLYGNIALEP